jgi:predicted 3-demethylubiquinone-9 3-methyltransferase (glyoxalase superfamily)
MYGPDEGPQGQVKFARFTLAGAQFSCIDSPIEHGFDMTPAVSLFIECSDARELERLFAELSAGGTVFMPLDDYGFSTRYGWVGDRFGVSWQLNLE